MSNHELHRFSKNNMVLMPTNTMVTDEYAKNHFDFYLTDDIRGDITNLHHFYRLHAMQPHTELESFKYDICCPNCHGMLKQVAPVIDMHELGLYVCPLCDNYCEGGKK